MLRSPKIKERDYFKKIVKDKFIIEYTGKIKESRKNNSQYALKFKQSNLFLDAKEKGNYARFANH